MKTHRFALDPDDYDPTAGCPGGDLVTCIDVCPGFNKVAFGLCVTECGKRCPWIESQESNRSEMQKTNSWFLGDCIIIESMCVVIMRKNIVK